METVARVTPLPARVARDDIRHTLQTHFRTQTTKPQTSKGSAQAKPSGGGAPAATGGRKRVYAFIQVQKKKLSLTTKRLFGGGAGGLGGSVSKSYILCVTVQDGAAQLHYLQFLSTLSVDQRQSWDFHRLEVIENNGLTSDKKRGAFSLLFADDEPWQWLVDDSESPQALFEFVWSLCALRVDQKQSLPRLVRFNLEELNEVAIHLNLGKRYGIDVDLLDHVAMMKKKAWKDGGENNRDEGEGADDMENAEGDDENPASDGQAGKNKKKTKPAVQRLTSAENEDAAALLAHVNWLEEPLASVEDALKKQLRVLEDENITFLLSFEGENRPPSQNQAPNTQQSSNPASRTNSKHSGAPPAMSTSASSSASTTSVDKILVAIEALQARIDVVADWTNESNEALDKTSQNMLHFESLNNQLEVHFKNSVALEAVLSEILTTLEIPREHMGVLIKPLLVFPEETGSGTSGLGTSTVYEEDGIETSTASGASVSTAAAQRDRQARLATTLAMLQRVDQAIKATTVFPASEMSAIRQRGEELIRLAKTYGEKLGAAFDMYLQRTTKRWALRSRQAAVAAANNGNSPTRSRLSSQSQTVRDQREPSSSVRMSRSHFMSSFDGTGGEGGTEMDWTFTNERFHTEMLEYQPLIAHLFSLDARIVVQWRQIYVKNVAIVYNPHVNALFRCLRDKLPRPPKGHHFSKPQALQTWSFHLSSTQLSDALGAAPLLLQALEHFVPLVTREQHFLSVVFFPEASDDPETEKESEELTVMLEGVFDKALKRLTDFGEAAAARNILDALALVVLIASQLETARQQSSFLYHLLVSFQLQMKRLLIKFAEDQESWIQSHHPDTRMAGVLSPIQKTLVMVSRLEESVAGKTDDPTLVSIYNRLLPTTMQWLDKASEAKPKYTALVRMENYLFLSERLQAINPSLDLPLAQYAAQAQAKYVENRQKYVAYIWEYEFQQLAPMFQRMEELLKTLPAQEIAFHTPRQDVRRVLDATTSTFEKSVKSMHERMKKHLTPSPKTLPLIWGHFIAYATQRLTRYEAIAAECYQLRLEPTPARATEMLQKFASATSSGNATGITNSQSSTS
ncbi:hypothetical protein Poli38472_011890 [Pythium oligandrum]|uniref:Exocyst complex component Sec3 C-terminal domain-containing protein n=1 Tax=Pythium oligandrum TaxID=41045 RepID=A0A8K1C994_PYTOL|nr:hypothetical protein Poli38472_011890 [Pythium oligandrum]|eukprot:TMW58302.1 hypothetical protein Poli38472_011890 [Pythium oligandrum]